MNIGESKEVALAELDEFAREISAHAKKDAGVSAVVLALHGDLGAGKTTFTQALGRLLGVAEPIVSPTFTIMKGYETTDDVFTHLIHMDAYRIDELSELGPLRFSELLVTPQTLFVIEWAERIKEALPQKTLNLTLEVASETTRTATLSRS
jgi:tRNA threonylcarbamoyladenosine biosynthesis protein TsaE